ncbi:SH3-domain-containing protein [Lentinus tigrinus ALCF2SS1-6]|uniref:SH3-domain-containing protein n=1 Tax=Lentinus tigrinus ALCF2SS1-6 TaxID=1328759 RepID=A0A5C2SEH9_9APHY|nr:SH3-domain-containing protein [Lentinus tigrinus ALCF2SS1-6]
MVFARLTPADKDAFFALLDEYFASRPDLFGGEANATTARAAATSAVHQVLSSSPSVPATSGWKRPDSATTAEISSSVGRVAAAAAALRASNGGADPMPSSAQNGFPRPPPRRNTSSSEEPATPAQPEHNKLIPQRKFGDVDMSSGKNMFSSLRNSTAAKHATPAQVAPPTPPAFKRNTDFAPPPRRVPSASASSPSPPAVSPSPPAPPALPRRNTQQEEGEWAEALYDYHSEDPGDLALQEGVRVLVVERTSDDWWTGEIDGRRGLIPAAYVKAL